MVADQIATGSLRVLSEQQLIDCSVTFGNQVQTPDQKPFPGTLSPSCPSALNPSRRPRCGPTAAPRLQGCKGGSMRMAFDYILANKGVDSEADYPYSGTGPNQCWAAAANRSVPAWPRTLSWDRRSLPRGGVAV